MHPGDVQCHIGIGWRPINVSIQIKSSKNPSNHNWPPFLTNVFRHRLQCTYTEILWANWIWAVPPCIILYHWCCHELMWFEPESCVTILFVMCSSMIFYKVVCLQHSHIVSAMHYGWADITNESHNCFCGSFQYRVKGIHKTCYEKMISASVWRLEILKRQERYIWSWIYHLKH